MSGFRDVCANKSTKVVSGVNERDNAEEQGLDGEDKRVIATSEAPTNDEFKKGFGS